MFDRNNYKPFYKRIICMIMIAVFALTVFCFSACVNQDDSGKSNETEDSVKAADPMTEEEMEADDSGGCIEDSEDLLY